MLCENIKVFYWGQSKAAVNYLELPEVIKIPVINHVKYKKHCLLVDTNDYSIYPRTELNSIQNFLDFSQIPSFKP